MFKRSGKKQLYTALAELPVPTSAFFQNSDHDGGFTRFRLTVVNAKHHLRSDPRNFL